MSDEIETREGIREYYGLGRYEFSPGVGAGHPNEFYQEFEDWLAAKLAAAERRGAVRALREAADHLVDSIVALRADNPVDLCYINCTMIDVREMRDRADKLEAENE